MLVAGVETDEGWDEAMQLALEEKPNADEDLSDPSQLAAVASETLSNAHRYFTGGSNATQARASAASAAATRVEVWRRWYSMAEARKEGVFFEGTKANGRMAQCEKDGHGVGIRGGARSSGGKMTRTAPWQHKGKCAGDLYAARMWVESCHVTAALDVIADVRRTQGWAEAALAECGFGKNTGRSSGGHSQRGVTGKPAWGTRERSQIRGSGELRGSLHTHGLGIGHRFGWRIREGSDRAPMVLQISKISIRR